MFETTVTARLGRDTLLFTDVTQSLETRIGRDDANAVALKELRGMSSMFRVNGGDTLEIDGLLVMRAFTDRVLGEGSTEAILNEIAGIEARDARVFFADYEENPSPKTHGVHALHKHPTVQKARNMASMWTMQDHPLVGQTGNAMHSNVPGRKVHWCMCLRTGQLQWMEDNVELYPGDVYVKLL